MQAFCPKCKAVVAIWTVLKMDEAERLLKENQAIEVVHPCPVFGRDHRWMVSKGKNVIAHPKWV